MATRSQRSRPLALLGCCAALGAGGCGADDEPPGAPLPPAAVAELDKQLRSIENRYAFGDGACADIERDNRPAVRRALERLPNSVDPEVRRALRQSFARLFELARRQCDTNKPPPVTTAPAPPPAPVPLPATTDTTPTDTAPTTTTDTSPTDTSETGTSKTTPRAPAKRQRTATQPNKPTTKEPRDTPSRTDSGGADSGSGGTPAPRPRRTRPNAKSSLDFPRVSWAPER